MPDPISPAPLPPPAYTAAMDDIEARAQRGELTIAQVRREILALRESLGIEAVDVARWAIQAGTSPSIDARPPIPAKVFS